MGGAGRKSPKSPPPKKEEFFTPAQVAEALRVNKGNANAAARVLGCCADTIRNYCAKYPEVQAARDHGTEVRLDLAEESLDKAVEKGDGWAVCFILKTKGRSRGYIERFETQAQNLNIDLSNLPTEQLTRIANGEDPLAVIAGAPGRG